MSQYVGLYIRAKQKKILTDNDTNLCDDSLSSHKFHNKKCTTWREKMLWPSECYFTFYYPSHVSLPISFIAKCLNRFQIEVILFNTSSPISIPELLPTQFIACVVRFLYIPDFLSNRIVLHRPLIKKYYKRRFIGHWIARLTRPQKHIIIDSNERVDS